MDDENERPDPPLTPAAEASIAATMDLMQRTLDEDARRLIP